jgi:restriction system protein
MMVLMDSPDHYEILGLSREATPEEIRSAYLRISKQVHTDKGGTDALFRQVNTAYEVLSDPRARAQYDRQLDGTASEAGSDRDNAPGWRRVHDAAEGDGDGSPYPPCSDQDGQPSAPDASRYHPATTAELSFAAGFARFPSAVVLAVGFVLLMIGLSTGDVGHGLAFLALIVTVLGFAGVIGHRRAVGTERLRRAGMYDIDIMSGQQFELRLVEAFQHAGYRVQHVGGVGDFGTDLLLEQKGIRTVVQAKRRSSSVGQPAVREAAAARAHYGAQRAMVVTNSVFTESARMLAASNQVDLWDRFLLGQFISAQLQAPPQSAMAMFVAELGAGCPVVLRGIGLFFLGLFAMFSSSGTSRRRTRHRW